MIKEEEEPSWRLVDDDHHRHGSVELVRFWKAKLEGAHQALGREVEKSFVLEGGREDVSPLVQSRISTKAAFL